MPDPSYFIAEAGQKVALSLHLTANFYPPLPDHVRTAFMDAFIEYWNREIDSAELERKLRDEAGYIGGLDKYNFWMFLNAEDIAHG